MTWHVFSLMPQLDVAVDDFPFYVGREAGPTANCVIIDDPTVSREQFSLEKRLGRIYNTNKSETNPGLFDGVEETCRQYLDPSFVHIVQIGDITIGIGTNREKTKHITTAQSQDLYMVTANGREIGPLTDAQLLKDAKSGISAKPHHCTISKIRL